MAARRVTLDQVAQRAGVSRTTASFVLTGRRDMRISADAQERVTRAARELDYRPNLLARSLRTNLSHTIGMVSDVVVSEPFAGDMVRGAMTTALAQERLVFVGETGGDARVEKLLVQSMLDRGVDGLIYAAMSTRTVRLSGLLRSKPLVLLNCRTQVHGVPSVVPDNMGAGCTAARTLLEAGHTSGIYLVGETPETVVAAWERLRGIETALATAGVHLAGQVQTIWWPEPAHRAVSALLASGVLPTAFIALNDRVAMGTMQALRDAGIRVPLDVSVVSFDNSDLASWLDPPLDSIALPHFELGRRAVELLLSDDADGDVHRIPMELHRRGSVAAPPQGTTRRGASRQTTPRTRNRLGQSADL